MNYSIKFLLFVLLANTTSIASAGIFFDNRTSFESFINDFVIDDFEDITAPDTPIPTSPSAINRSGYSLSDTGFASLNLDASPSGINNLLDGDTVGGILNQQNALIIAFDPPITAVGFDYGTINTVLEVRIGSETLPLPPAQLGGFLGYVSLDLFDEVRIFNNSTANAGFNIDNLTYGNAPEPSSALLTLMAVSATNVLLSRSSRN